MSKNISLFLSMAIIFTGSVLPVSVNADGFSATQEERRLLPPYCQNRGENAALRKKTPHGHHLCSGLAFVVRADKSVTTGARKSNLESAIGEFNYVLGHTQAENSDGRYNGYLALVSLHKAKALKRLKRNAPAIRAFNETITLNPKISKAYAGLSDIYRDLGKLEEARETLENGLKQVPGSRSLKRRLDKLEGEKKPL
jgi:tetratricopeptide (TPR) repeat protein